MNEGCEMQLKAPMLADLYASINQKVFWTLITWTVCIFGKTLVGHNGFSFVMCISVAILEGQLLVATHRHLSGQFKKVHKRNGRGRMGTDVYVAKGLFSHWHTSISPAPTTVSLWHCFLRDCVILINWLIERKKKVPLTLLIFCQLQRSISVKPSKHFMPLMLYSNTE